MKIKLDENLGSRCADLLRDAGHDVVTVAEQGMASASDKDLIEVCGIEQRCVVTLDLDFSNPLVFPPSQSAGIAVMRVVRQVTLQQLHELARTLIAALAQGEIAGKLWIVEAGQIREYQPELGP